MSNEVTSIYIESEKFNDKIQNCTGVSSHINTIFKNWLSYLFWEFIILKFVKQLRNYM